MKEHKNGKADYQKGQRQKRKRERKKQERDCEIVKECMSGREEYLRQEPGRTGKRNGKRRRQERERRTRVASSVGRLRGVLPLVEDPRKVGHRLVGLLLVLTGLLWL